jgi:hypothetical protein F3_00887
MVKETVLEIEFQPVFDKWAWRISKQDEDILPRGIFEDKNLKVATDYKPEYKKEINYLYVKGVFFEHDNDIDICSTEEKALLEEKVKAINEKYGIKKRWRANFGGEYCFIDDNFSIKWDRDKEYFVDNRKYENGNYFETKTEAEEYAEYMKQKSLEWHERKGE